MERIIHLKGSIVTLYEDKILIEDDSSKNRKLFLIIAFCWLVNAGINTWSYRNDGEDYRLLLIGIGVFLFLFYLRWLWLSNVREISLKEVKSVKFRTSALGAESVEMRLNDGLVRRVDGIDIVADELRQYFAEHGLEE